MGWERGGKVWYLTYSLAYLEESFLCTLSQCLGTCWGCLLPLLADFVAHTLPFLVIFVLTSMSPGGPPGTRYQHAIFVSETCSVCFSTFS